MQIRRSTILLAWLVAAINVSAADTELLAKSFPYQGSQFYLDTYWVKGALAIDPNKYKNANVTTTFSGTTTVYSITLCGYAENDGKSSWKVFVDGRLIGEHIAPLAPSGYPESRKTFAPIKVNSGSQIKVEGFVGSNDNVEFSRARWTKLILSPATAVLESSYRSAGQGTRQKRLQNQTLNGRIVSSDARHRPNQSSAVGQSRP